MTKTYDVTVTFAHPAWDERDGLRLSVRARTKADAVKSARRTIRDAGHMGKISFSATEADVTEAR